MNGREDDDSANSTSAEETNKSSPKVRPNVLPMISSKSDIQIPDDVWLKERKCLLILLQCRMLLREMAEYAVKLQRIQSGNLTIEEIQNLLALSGEGVEESDFVSGTPNLTNVEWLMREREREREGLAPPLLLFLFSTIFNLAYKYGQIFCCFQISKN
jgi:hypothetical protein